MVRYQVGKLAPGRTMSLGLDAGCATWWLIEFRLALLFKFLDLVLYLCAFLGLWRLLRTLRRRARPGLVTLGFLVASRAATALVHLAHCLLPAFAPSSPIFLSAT